MMRCLLRQLRAQRVYLALHAEYHVEQNFSLLRITMLGMHGYCRSETCGIGRQIAMYIIGRHFVSGLKQCCLLHHVLKLAHIAGPTVMKKHSLGILA